jgi:hypothetical protein
MEVKLFEVRDRMTLIPCIAMRPEITGEGKGSRDVWLLSKAGYGKNPKDNVSYVFFTPLTGLHEHEIYCDYFTWINPTLRVAHEYIQRNWLFLTTGDVIDIEFITGQSKTPKLSDSPVQS